MLEAFMPFAVYFITIELAV